MDTLATHFEILARDWETEGTKLETHTFVQACEVRRSTPSKGPFSSGEDARRYARCVRIARVR